MFSVHVTTNHNCAVIKNTPEIKTKIKIKNQLLPGSFAKTEVHYYFFCVLLRLGKSISKMWYAVSHSLGKLPCKRKMKNSTQNTYCQNPVKVTEILKNNQKHWLRKWSFNQGQRNQQNCTNYTHGQGLVKSLSTLIIQCQVQLQNQSKPKWEKICDKIKVQQNKPQWSTKPKSKNKT